MGRLKEKKSKSIGSDFEDWLEEEGILEDVEIAATKKAFVIQPQAEMKKKIEVVHDLIIMRSSNPPIKKI